MTRVFNFDTKKAIRLNLYLDELYVLDWIIHYYSKHKVIFSTQYPDYFLLTHKKVQKECAILRSHSIRQISTILKRLSGDTPESVRGEQYPLSYKMSSERGFRNTYYKLNVVVIKSLMEKEIAPMREVPINMVSKGSITDNFVKQYKKIVQYYDFKHDIRKTSRTLLDAQEHIIRILQGTFISELEWDNIWLQQLDISMLKDATFDTILKSVGEYAKAMSEGGWLSKNPHKLSLASFFYNPNTKKSMFIHCLQKYKKVPLDGEQLHYFMQIARKFADKFGFKEDDVLLPLYDIYNYWYTYFDKLIEYQSSNRRNYWYNHFGRTPRFGILMNIYTEFLNKKSYGKKLTLYNIGKNKKGWYGFVKYVYDEYNKLKIEFNNNFYKKLNEGLDYDEEYGYTIDNEGEDK